MTIRAVLTAVIAVMALLSSGTLAHAQMTGAPIPGYSRAPGTPASVMPAPLTEVGFDQRLNERLPLDVELVDEEGRTRPLGAYFGARPVVLAFVYYDCPMLCTQVLSAMTSALRVLSLEPGKDFDVVAVSFDPRETPHHARTTKTVFVERYGRSSAGKGWHFLTGSEVSIARLTSAAGFRYVWDDDTKQFAHPSGLVVLTPDGRLARYLFGLEYGPRDLRLSLVEAAEGRVGSPIDTVLLYCYQYDPAKGRYGLVVMGTLRVAGVVTVLALGAFVTVMLRRERRKRSLAPTLDPAAGHR
jgi:protein SCO1/2